MKDSHPLLSRYVVPDMPSADELMPYLRQIDAQRWYSNFGPLVSAFEHKMEKHLTATQPVKSPSLALTSLMSCYHALQIGLQLFRLPEKAQVLIPAVTFPACPLAVRHAGAEPVLADIDNNNWQLTPEIARRAAQMTSIHAVMPVAVYGVPVAVEAWDQFSDDTGIPVIIDAAAALEAQPIPRNGLVAHSMHATKPFSIGEGGLLVGRRRDWIDEARCISNFGTRNRIALQDGGNAKMSEYQGAVALAQFERWPQMKQKRRTHFARYRELIERAELPLRFQHDIDQAIVSAVMLESNNGRATSIVNALNARCIMAHRMYLPPLYHHPHFGSLGMVNVEGRLLPGTASTEEKTAFMRTSESMHENVFGIPFHTFMDEGDMMAVVQALTEVVDVSSVRTKRVL